MKFEFLLGEVDDYCCYNLMELTFSLISVAVVGVGVAARMLKTLLPSSCRRTSGALYPGVPHLVNVRSYAALDFLDKDDKSFAKPKSTSLISPVSLSINKFSVLRSL